MPDYVLPAGDARAADELEASVLVSVGDGVEGEAPELFDDGEPPPP